MGVVAAALTGCGAAPSHPAISSVTVLNVVPTRLRWVTFDGMRIPEADQGPHDPDSVHPTGFDHSPTGAALAAINATVRLSVANDRQWPDICRLNVAPGPGRDAFALDRVQVSLDRVVQPGEAEQVIGYRVRAYNGWGADVDIFTAAPDRSELVTYTQVAWTATNDDWGLVLPDPSDPGQPDRKTPIAAIPRGGVVLDTHYR